MRTIGLLVTLAVLALPLQSLWAQGEEASKTANSSTGEAQAGKPEKKELDVSRMPFDAEAIREVVRFHMPEIQECYEKVLSETGKRIEGKAVVGFIIDPNGNVTEARVLPKKSTVKDERVLDCVLTMKSWFFPKPGDNRDHPIEYPFVLKVKP